MHRIVLATLALLGLAATAAAADGFTPLFDGKSLDGWEGDTNVWRVEDGAITGQTNAEKPIKKNTFLIWRQGEVDDFELVFECRFGSEKGNSGVQYRSFEDEAKLGKWVIGGYQADMETGKKFSGILYGEHFGGILGLRGDRTVIGADRKRKVIEQFADGAALGQHVKAGDWNQYRIVARGFHLVHEINGVRMTDVTDEDQAARRRSGLLALQVHQGPPMKIQFRNIRLKRLPLEGAKKVVFVGGRPSHGYGSHEHNAGCLLLARLLNQHVPGVVATVYRSGWPKDSTALDNADALVVFADGGRGNPILPQLDAVGKFAAAGKGLAFLHYAVEVPKEAAGRQMLDWTGGYFEQHWSVNPHFAAEFKQFSDHPIARGLKPFSVDDEWYYHMRFREGMEGVAPVLTCIPPDATRQRKDGPHSGNPTVRAGKGQPEHVAWARQRPDGGRGFGFTGGHWHWNWANDSFRTAVVNGIVWTAGLDVPAGGVKTPTPSLEELKANQDEPVPANFDWKRVETLLLSWAK